MARTPGAGPVLFCLLFLGPGSAVAQSPPVPESVVRCLPCHHGEYSDQVGEWLASPYSEREGGRGCLHCHAPRCRGMGESDREVAGSSSQRPRVAVRLTITAVCIGDAVEAEVAVTNVGVGHFFPSGPNRRTLVLEVVARDREGKQLPSLARPVEPVERLADRDITQRVFVRDAPRGDDSTPRGRLAPFATDVSRFRFAAPEEGPAQVSAHLALLSPPDLPSEIANTTSRCSTEEESR